MRSSLSWEVPTSSLTTVAWQIAYAIENTQLIARKAEEERLRRERRTPEQKGYNDWLNYLNAHPTDFREMVRGFMDSIEYRMRFGQP